MNLFYSTEIDTHTITLVDDEAKHCTKVLRKSIGDEVFVIDGNGNLYTARIESIGKRDCICSIIDKVENFGNHDYYVRMCVAPTKNIDRFEFFVEKAVEIGVDEIIPVCSENSERKVVNVERIERIVLSAMKQSYKAKMPLVTEMTPIKTIITNSFSGLKCIAHCEEEKKSLLRDAIKDVQEITILIGPEGDFSLSEISSAKQNGWIPVSLGESRLRTETAAIAAVHTVNLMKQIS